MRLGKLTALDMTPLGWLGRKTSTQTIFDSDYALILCPLWKSNTQWNFFMILGRNVEQDERTCNVQEWKLLASLLLEFSALSCVWIWIRVHSVTRIPFGIFWWYLVEMEKGRDDVLCTRMTTLAFLLLELSPLLVFKFDFVSILLLQYPLEYFNFTW